MTFPLIERLTSELGYPLASADTIAELIASCDTLVLFFAGDPNRYPESNDVAVILPELIAAFDGQLSPAVVAGADEPALKQRYPFDVWPSLVFLHRGVTLGTISKVRDWADYKQRIDTMLSARALDDSTIPALSL